MNFVEQGTRPFTVKKRLPVIKVVRTLPLIASSSSPNNDLAKGSLINSTTLSNTSNLVGRPSLTSKQKKKRVIVSTLMTKSSNFNINYALDYTCHRLTLDSNETHKSAFNFCGKCNSCQISTHLNRLKQWFDRASHIAVKKLLIGLAIRIDNHHIYKHLSDLLRPLTQSKDFVYARNNKFLPSCDEDHMKPTNNRCLDEDYVNKEINDIWEWYATANEFIKLNFMLSLLNKSEQAVVFLVILKINSILDASRAIQVKAQPTDSSHQQPNVHLDKSRFILDDMVIEREYDANVDTSRKSANQTSRKFFNDESNKSEIVYDAFDEEEDNLREDDMEVQKIFFYDDEYQNDVSGGVNNADDGEFYFSSAKEIRYVDFIRQLPVHLSKSILKSLNKKCLQNCTQVSKYWANLVKEVQKEEFLHKILLDDLMFLRGTSSKGSNPKYANNVDVKVPNLHPATNEIVLLNPSDEKEKEAKVKVIQKDDCSWANAYKGCSTRIVIMEERNVFCGPYNVLLLKEKRDPHRIIHFNGKNTIAFGSFDKRVRFIDLKSAVERPNTIQGHAGSIKCVYICEAKGIVLTGSYDTSIRCWSLTTGKCLRIYQGHQQTVNCISMYDENETIITGSSDKTCRIWLLGNKRCYRTFKHYYAIVSVAIGEEMCVTGGRNGKIKVFNLLQGTLIKTISAHQGPVTSVKFDRWHLLSCGLDGYALLFSSQGKHKKCIMAMRHPKEVLCLEYQYLRAITGSADGKVRIWNILTGDCIRVMRGNSLCDPVLSLTIVDNRILINTENNVIMMEFEKIKYEYGSNESDISQAEKNYKKAITLNKKPKSYSSIRASRMELVATSNSKLFEDGRKSVLDHSARPISAKNLKDAKLLHTITSRQQSVNLLPRNTMGDVSESALQKHHALIQSINQTIQNRTSLSVLSQSRERDLSNQAYQLINLESKETYRDDSFNQASKLLDDSSNLINTSSSAASLNQAKVYLREQLKELKQSQQLTQEESAQIKRINAEVDETKSCIESRMVNRLSNNNRYVPELSNSTLIRPMSSPSKVDTKTKLKHLDQTQVSSLILKTHRSFQMTKQSECDSEHDLTEDINNNLKKHPNYVQQASRVELKSQAPIIGRPQTVHEEIVRPVTASRKLVRSKSALIDPKMRPPYQSTSSSFGLNHMMDEFKPSSIFSLSGRTTSIPSNRARITPRTDVSVELNKLSSQCDDNLKLMTFKEIDIVVDKINGLFNSSDKDKTHQTDKQADLYKKMWLLKSKGQYHGSLLAKPKAIAPEIRE